MAKLWGKVDPPGKVVLKHLDDVQRTAREREAKGLSKEETQAKIDVVKSRLIRDYGYDEESATDVLNYVASIFARGDTKD
jgi:hypothetical protein